MSRMVSVLLDQLPGLGGQFLVRRLHPAVAAPVGDVHAAEPGVLVCDAGRGTRRAKWLPRALRALELCLELRAVASGRPDVASTASRQSRVSSMLMPSKNSMHSAISREPALELLPVDQRLLRGCSRRSSAPSPGSRRHRSSRRRRRSLLHRGQRPVRAGDRLKQVVISQRLVEVHDLLDRAHRTPSAGGHRRSGS